MNERIRAILELSQGPEVLDVGCAGHVPEPESPYWLHGALVRRFARVVGIDVNAANVLRLRAEGYDVRVGNAETLELGERFDTVVAGEVIEHLANPGLFLERAKPHLKAGGRIVLSTPVPFGLLHLLYAWRNWPKTCSNPEHTLWLCPSTLGELAGRVGLRVVECRLVDDYQSATGSRGYRMFVWLMRTLGRMLPRRLRCNCMVAVLEVEEDAGGEGIARWAR